MAYRLASLLLFAAVWFVLGACGNEIGDACAFASDCSPNGDRICDPSSFEGYCTIQGCDYSTCPDEAACIRFFSGNFSNKTCDPACDGLYDPENEACPDLVPPAVQCSLDELCSIAGARENTGQCVARSSEVRYCMRTCDSDGDCREGYECRDLAKMKLHGGEPVLAPGLVVDESAPKFCAAAPVTP